MPSKIHFMANGVFTTSLAGGDFHFLELAKVVADEGFEINYFGGHALKEALAQNRIPGTVTLTDDAASSPRRASTSRASSRATPRWAR